jgi:PAS domain-containing protein
VLFREPAFWDRYKAQILGSAGLFVLQTALIITLLVEHRRRRNANIGLRESEARYRNVVDMQTELICRFLSDTTLTFVNEAYCRYFGKSEEELIGTRFVLLIPESMRDSMLRYIGSFVENPRTETQETPGNSTGWNLQLASMDEHCHLIR